MKILFFEQTEFLILKNISELRTPARPPYPNHLRASIL
jgi:hypothetical protein